ncbi:hypothetical protein KP509_13G028100 [Ceratopteris richardii]|nr:hypothetical protein KP509_13G028100 [Ceratopteris richardii]
MQQEGHLANTVTFTSVLKACSSTGSLKLGKEVHTFILKEYGSHGSAEPLNEPKAEESMGFSPVNRVLGSSLLDMYAKCGELEKAQEVFDELQSTDVVCWTALIKGYSECGHVERAFHYFDLMKGEGFSPDKVTFACILKICGSREAICKGEKIHAEIVGRGFVGHNVILQSALLDMYAKCGKLLKARQVFDELPARDLVAWNSLIAGYIQHGQDEEAFRCLSQMEFEGQIPDQVSLVCFLKSCGNIGAADRGKLIHSEIIRKGLLIGNITLGNALIDMYTKCGILTLAREVFNELSVRDVVSWNTLVSGYSRHGHGEAALKCYTQMLQAKVSPSIVTFASILKACGDVGAFEKGEEVHAEILRDGSLERGAVVGNALVNMYCKCGQLIKAQQLFNDLQSQDPVLWNVLISGFCDYGYPEEAIRCFEQMLDEGLSPREVTFICILKACSSMKSAELGREIHTEIARKGYLKKSATLGSSLVDMYAKCGVLEEAQEVFDELPFQDVVSWNALLTGYCEHQRFDDLMNCFERTKNRGLIPDPVTFSCIVRACNSVGAVEKGIELHSEIVRKGLWGVESVLGNVVVDMYARGGLLSRAQQVFDELHVQDIVSWNTLIMGHCQHGLGKEALDCFHHMQKDNIHPDAVTFVSILKACGSMGLPEKGQVYYDMMTSVYGLTPGIEHQTCMVYFDGLTGNFDKALADVQQWPFFDSLPAWLALLGACQKRGNVDLGRLAFKHVVELDEQSADPCMCMNNIYRTVGMQEEEGDIEYFRTALCQEIVSKHSAP